METLRCDSGDLLKSSECWGSYSVRPSDDGQAALFHDTLKYLDTYTVLSAEYTTAVGRLPWNDLSVSWCDMAVDLLGLADQRSRELASMQRGIR